MLIAIAIQEEIQGLHLLSLSAPQETIFFEEILVFLLRFEIFYFVHGGPEGAGGLRRSSGNMALSLRRSSAGFWHQCNPL